jgi:hypothetical protein
MRISLSEHFQYFSKAIMPSTKRRIKKAQAMPEKI